MFIVNCKFLVLGCVCGLCSILCFSVFVVDWIFFVVRLRCVKGCFSKVRRFIGLYLFRVSFVVRRVRMVGVVWLSG